MRKFTATIELNNILDKYHNVPQSEDEARELLLLQLQDHEVDRITLVATMVCDSCEDEVYDAVHAILGRDYCTTCLEDVSTDVSMAFCTSCNMDTPQVEISHNEFGSFDVCVVCQSVQ